MRADGKVGNEEMFACKRCGSQIGGHNQYCHDGMCDDCFFGEHFPENLMDLERIGRIMDEEEGENLKFRDILKDEGRFDQDEFNRIVEEVERHIDCTACANCCKALLTVLTGDDVGRISQHLRIPREEFIAKFTREDEAEGLVLRGLPCAFLRDNRCTIYEARPAGCAGYPFLKKDLPWKTITFFSNARACPIAFNVLQEAKEQYLEQGTFD